MKRTTFILGLALALSGSSGWLRAQSSSGQQPPPTPPAGQSGQTPGTSQPSAGPPPAGQPPASSTNSTNSIPDAIQPPADYVIGPGDKIAVVFWREKDISADVVVRPDGMITLPLLNDVQASGLTPEQLRVKVQESAAKFVNDPLATVVIKEIRSRRVFVTGEVNKPGPYGLGAPTTVLQMLAMAGGLRDFADKEDIVVMRTENGKTQSFKFNYKDVTKGKNLQQNILLKPGDIIIVP